MESESYKIEYGYIENGSTYYFYSVKNAYEEKTLLSVFYPSTKEREADSKTLYKINKFIQLDIKNPQIAIDQLKIIALLQ